MPSSPEERAATRRSVRRVVGLWLGLGLLFVLLAVGVTWPLARELERGIPLGTEGVATVPLFNLWTLSWNVESLSARPAEYWHAPIFHPTPYALLLSEPMPLTGAVATLLAGFTGSVVAAYNLILIGSLALNAVLATVLLRSLGLGWIAAAAGGCLVELLPFSHQELGVLQLVPLAGPLAMAIGVRRFATAANLKNGLVLGAATAVAYGISVQTTVFSVLVLAPAAFWLWLPQLHRRRSWANLLAGGLLFLLVVSPLAVAQARVAQELALERDLDTVRKQSARLGHYLTSPWPPLLPAPAVAKDPSAAALWPGSLRLVLALAGAIAGLRARRWRRGTVAALLVLGASFFLSFGPNLEVAGLSPALVLRSLPGLSLLRSFFRFALFFQLAVAGLGALALDGLARSARQRLSRPALANAGVAALAILAVVEVPPVMGPIERLPPAPAEVPWLSWVVASTEPDDVLAFVPFPLGLRVEDYLETSRQLYWQTFHWRPVVNGYSGFFPLPFLRLKYVMPAFPSERALRALRQAEVRYCIVRRGAIGRQALLDSLEGELRLVPVFQDDRSQLDIFEIRP